MKRAAIRSAISTISHPDGTVCRQPQTNLHSKYLLCILCCFLGTLLMGADLFAIEMRINQTKKIKRGQEAENT